MSFHLCFSIPIYTDEHSTFPKPEIKSYDYWVGLLSYFLSNADFVEIQCWNVEQDTITELKSLFHDSLEVTEIENITIFKGPCTVSLKEYLLSNYENKQGELKWFTVNLFKGLDSIFHSGHWGTEFYIPLVSEKQLEFIKSVTPDDIDFEKYSTD